MIVKTLPSGVINAGGIDESSRMKKMSKQAKCDSTSNTTVAT